MRHQETRKNRRAGFTLMELLIVIAIILVIAGVAIPKFNQVQMQAKEVAAIQNIGALHKAQAMYMSQHGRYAASLGELGPPASGQAGQAAADLIPKSLSEGKFQGYVFRVQATEEGYAINADPERWNNTGARTFYSDQTTVIRENRTKEPATAQSPESSK